LGHFNLIGQEFALDPTLLLAASRLDMHTMLRQVLQLVCRVPNGAHQIGELFADADTRALKLILACIETLALNDAATDAIARSASRSSARTIRAAGRRLREMSRSATPKLARRHDGLTSRETQVLSLMAHGLSNADIAARLFVTVATVKTHVNHIFTKLGVTSRVEAVLAYQRDLTPSP
jgi:DNA-binding NarL/FixJ family response regulator